MGFFLVKWQFFFKVLLNITEKEGQILVQLAYLTISERLGKQLPDADNTILKQALLEPVFEAVGGTFVTLKKNQNLRGCIGNLVSNMTIVEGVRSNATSAAFNDYRFKALSVDELESIDVEVSVLTTPKKLDYTNWQDLLTKIRVDTDGVILRKGGSSATFLPQVWRQLPNAESFLSQLCLKAGLSNDAWKIENPDVEIYQVSSFSRQY